MLLMEQTVVIQELQRKIYRSEEKRRRNSLLDKEFKHHSIHLDYVDNDDEYCERLDTASTAESK